MSDFLKRFGDDLKKNIPGFIAATVTEVKSIFYYPKAALLKPVTIRSLSKDLA